MKRILSGLAVLFLALTAWADDEPKPKHNTLTPAEIAEGWILLFDGETTFGWRALNVSKWTIASGMLAPQSDKPGLLVTTTAFVDYDLKLQYQSRGDTKAEVVVAASKDGATQSGAVLLRDLGDWTECNIQVHQGRLGQHSFRSLGGSRRIGTTATKQIGGVREEIRPGHIAISGNNVVLRDIKLKPVNTTSLFNGKDLTGWKEFPGRKSKFSVTPEGFLNIKDGPGDLQTEKAWADFVLQLDCISNGKYLNSGVFFRCRPGEYQQGYEAQIQNDFSKDPPKEYVVEEHDPQTNQLTEKKKVTSAAADYGTGAIYRRVPARRGVAKDNEWFTMTVVAQGRHIATWVNGFQVVDWTDNRPLKDNARNGCRLEAGPISLQGHDPTTNLSFRNFRIADLSVQQGKEEKRIEKKE